jgi:hypothetical protein
MMMGASTKPPSILRALFAMILLSGSVLLVAATSPSSGQSALHLAAESGSAVTVDLLLATGADVNNQDSVSTSPPPLTRQSTATITGCAWRQGNLTGRVGAAGRVDSASPRGRERPHRGHEEAACGGWGVCGHAVRCVLSLLPSRPLEARSRQVITRLTSLGGGAVGCRLG